MLATFKLDGCHVLEIGGDLPRAMNDPASVSLQITRTQLPMLMGQTAPTPTLSEADLRVRQLDELQKLRRNGFDPTDPDVVWYGPHYCESCGFLIVKSSHESGGHAFDVPSDMVNGNPAIVYPNTRWLPHIHYYGVQYDTTPRAIWAQNLKPSEARAIASMLLSAATEAKR